MRWKIGLVLLVVVLAGVGASLGFSWPFGQRARPLRLAGIVEIQEVRLGPRVAGRVKEVHVQEGDRVKPGRVLVTLDVPELLAQREMAQAQVRLAHAEWQKAVNGSRTEEKEVAEAAEKAAKARLDRLVAGNREEDKAYARSELAAAQAEERLALIEYNRASQLLSRSATGRADFDNARTALERHRNRAAMASARFKLMEAGPRDEEIDEARQEHLKAQANLRLVRAGTRYEDRLAAEARLHEARARLRELEVRIDEATVRAPEAALVEVVAVRQGDLVSAHQPVVRVLRTADLWVKIFVPETELSRVRLGQEVEVKVDGYPNRTFAGKVTHIGAESEFTPRNVQTVDERRYQVFGVRVRVADHQGVFKSGMAADVLVPLAE